MNQNLIIRSEKSSDIEVIFDITAAAFEGQPYSRQTEPYIINALRNDGALAISLVAELDDEVVGHIAFSTVEIADGSKDWYTLGPVSVMPKYQKQKIGSALIIEGLSQLKSIGAKGCILVGDPAYYKRFGFKNYDELTMEGVPAINLP